MLTSLRSLLRRALLGLLAVALLTLALPAATNAVRAGELPYGQGLLWRVEKDGGPANWVLGTIHSTDARLRKLPPEVDRAIGESRTMAFELLESPEGTAQLAQAMRLPPGRRLEDILGPELFRRASEAGAPLGLAPETLQVLRPWTLGLFLGLPPVERVRAAKGEPAFDHWLQAEGRRRGKTLQALETLDEQIEVFDGMSEAEQVAMVSDMLSDYENIEANFNRLFRAYLKGDIAAIMAEANDISGVSDAAAAERLAERLIDDRNRTMAARILPLLRDGGAFVAIGAAHLPGQDGVLARLEQRGYRITRAY